MTAAFFKKIPLILSLYVGGSLPVSALSQPELEAARKIYAKYDDSSVENDMDYPAGIKISKMLQENKLLEAKTALHDILKTPGVPTEIVNLMLAKIAIKEGRFKDFQKFFTASRISSWRNFDLVQALYASLPKAQKNWLVEGLVRDNFFARKSVSACPYFELTERKNRALFLYTVLQHHNLPKKNRRELIYELYVLLPEAISVEVLKMDRAYKKFMASLLDQDFVLRIENLLTFGKNMESKQTFTDAMALKKKAAPIPCELDYVDAKADRKMKKYDLARKRFLAIAARCPLEIKIKARFMDLNLATIQGDEDYLSQFDAFVADHPKHSFADDVLLFKANLLLNKGRDSEAQEVLGRIINEFPQGDTILRAYFLQGFNWAKQGNTTDALKAFDALKKMSSPDSIEYAQAKYWSSRLGIFRDVFSLKHPKQDKNAKKSLHELAAAKNPTVYSWLAMDLLSALKENVPTAPKATPKTFDALAETTGDLRFKLIRNLIKFGFRDEALSVMRELPMDITDTLAIKELALYFDVLNRPEQAHQKLVRCNPLMPRVWSAQMPGTYHRISFPKPFSNEVLIAAKRFKVPEQIIFGLVRQESGFIAESCSWAGAKGLMQLMHPSALGQAKKMKIEALEQEDLYKPDVNILLGTSLLRKYWEQFQSLPLALAAYNAGPSSARLWSTKNPLAPIDTLLENVSIKETRDYLKSVLSNVLVYAQMEGIKIPLDMKLSTLNQ